ncbi:hypothetical protein EVAR_24177_1 [Eumeta japonica]|uniref:Uncharacterized protein n=1 Tax=Eumeta variegata TaxID=151549 RepID=A0A4C1W735_EUMVA|nr:hypothetical protein EVAR_24177_1 [Eumeta japonica]
MFSAPNKILTVEYWYQIFQFPGLEKFVNFLHFDRARGVSTWARASAARASCELKLLRPHAARPLDRRRHVALTNKKFIQPVHTFRPHVLFNLDSKPKIQ